MVRSIMAAPSHKTRSTHRSAFAQGTHQFDIAGYSTAREALVGSVRSGSFHAGGFIWALVCRLHDRSAPCGLASISLELSKNETDEDVVAMASLRIDESSGTGKFPAAVWCSDKPKTFDAWSTSAVAWELAVPVAFRRHESRYIDKGADCLTIHCTVDVLLQQQESSAAAGSVDTRNCFVSVPPPPSISRDLHRLLRERQSPEPDVTFVLDDGTEIQAHKLVMAMRSPVFRAEFLCGDMKERSTRHLTMDDMSASTLRAMLYFIYTDEQPTPRKGRCQVAMAQDLLVAADLYDLERLRLMCEKILSGSLDVGNVMATLMHAHGRHSCQQLEALCIDFMASDPDVYNAVEATEEYKELEKTYPSFIHEITKKVAKSTMARIRSPTNTSSMGTSGGSSSREATKSMSRYTPPAVMIGTHEFTIQSLSWVRETHSVGQYIRSGSFKVAGYEWTIDVYPSGGTEDTSDHIDVFIRPTINDGDIKVKASVAMKPVHPTDKSPPFPPHNLTHTFGGKACRGLGWPKFITFASANSHYVGHDGSFTIQCQVTVATESSTSSTIGTFIPGPVLVPPSNLVWHLERLLASDEGWDVKFLVEESEIHAHGLVVAARSPALHEAVQESATNHVKIDGIRAVVFKAMLHFIYTDKLPRVQDLVAPAVGHSTMVVAGELLAVACRFRLDRMARLCENLLAEKITPEYALATLRLAGCHGCTELEAYCIEYISQPHVVKDVMKTLKYFIE
ncbi:BTB/POZ and MATH domain-containing protein 1-like [Triticum aestivum]|uniref:BTB/POZ and MATH domain-containing protein 1-like n=1 Tax=Triticum aestivum TaxID=4565 RepID=UPI001D01345A|nr:BTB/POZ and MATH domain-containing protein 1-like [Triticum aestivum]